ncbi:SIMPL domain-containing protein [Candidatus Berkelbacteria bacterium]|nr:SIMPL domain-containing protein [Candidatus Berkelbacteria bacterium]
MILKLNLKVFILALILVIVGMLAVWRPWKDEADTRQITTNGEATVSRAPDEFVFSPVYEKVSEDSKTAVREVTVVGNEILAKLRELGVVDDQMTTSVTTNNDRVYAFEPNADAPNEYHALYSITATLNDLTLAQSVLDYLATTPVLYAITPQSTFSTKTRKALEDEARKLALADARERAEDSVAAIGARLGKVITISEPSWGGPVPLMGAPEGVGTANLDSNASASPELLIGEQDLTYTISVTFALK